MRFFEFSDARLFSWKQVLPNRYTNNLTITMLDGDDGSPGDLMNEAELLPTLPFLTLWFSGQQNDLIQDISGIADGRSMAG
jgi:hypothetical protein